MKELSIEEKAKAYDRAIKVIKYNLDALNKITETGTEVANIQPIKNWFYRAFPELKESEDEKIKKRIIALINAHGQGKYKEEMLAWTEKQGEQKQTVIIPRFRVGDVITSTKNSALKYKIKAVGVLNELGEYDYVVEDVTDKGRILKMSISKVDEWGVVVEQKLAWSEEDKNILDAITYTVKNSGYKHCIGVSNEMMITFIKSLKDRVQPRQKQEWVEEDEKMFNVVHDLAWESYKTSRRLDIPTFGAIDSWLKSFKDRVQSQPKQEWSEEDKNRFTNLIHLIKCSKENNATKAGFIEFINKLKSLRPQSTWKPSDEYINALEYFIRSLGESGYSSSYDNKMELLRLLLFDLKKLKE